MSEKHTIDRLMVKKVILDVTCGGRRMWFQKEEPHTVYMDKRVIPKGQGHPSRPNFEIMPDVVADFTNLPFQDKSFKLVVFDPPHILRDETKNEKLSRMKIEYGWLPKDSWQDILKKGFQECWRVLEDYGVLIFKWSETDVPLKDVLSLFPVEPLFGNRSHRSTHWLVFMKFPEGGDTKC